MYALARRIRGKAVTQASKEMKEHKYSKGVTDIVQRDFSIIETLSPEMKEYLEFKRVLQDEDGLRLMVATTQFGPEKEVKNIDQLVDLITLAARGAESLEEIEKIVDPFEDDEQRND